MRLFDVSKIPWPLLMIMSILLLVGVSCSGGEKAVPPSAPMPAPSPAPPGVGITYPSTFPVSEGEGGVSGPALGADRLVIRRASLDIVVNDFTDAAGDISAVAERLGGYTVSSHIAESTAGAVSSISIRVPAEKLNEALQALRELALDVKTLDTSSEDITEEFTDLQAQLKNLEAAEAQFLDIMEKAKTVEEILQVQRELTNVRGQIESVKGRIKYLEGNVRESLITVTMRLSPEAKPVVTRGWSIIETLRSATRGLVSFGRVLVDVVIWLVIFSPVWVVLILVAIYLNRRRKRVTS